MKRLMISLLAGAAGITSMLAGLGWDAWLHAEDPTLAQREGIFTLGNPGHVLLGLGVLLATGGLLAALHIAWGMARPTGFFGRPIVRSFSMRASALASIGAVVFALAVSAGGHDHGHADASASAAHVHDDGAMHPHDDGATLPHDSAMPHAHTTSDDLSESVSSTDRRDVASAASEQAQLASENVGHQHSTATNATPEEIACGQQLIRDTQSATARFANFDVAAAEGYRSNPNKPNATHFANPIYRRDGNTMDLANPESLIYYTNPVTGEKALLGVMFVMPRGESGPQPCGAVTTWHTHAACSDRDAGVIIPIDHGATCPEGYRYAESAEMMHVWFVPGRKNGVAPIS